MARNELNRVSIQGIVASDPIVRENGKTTFSVANHESYKDKGRTNWIPCGAWRSTGEFIKKYFHAGDPIILTGKLSTWQDKNSEGGAYRWEVVVENCYFSGSKRRTEEPDDSAYEFDQSYEGDLPF